MQRRFFAWLAAEGREEQLGEGGSYGPHGTFSRRETYALIAILRTGATPVQRWNAAYALSHPTGDRQSTEALRREAYAAALADRSQDGLVRSRAAEALAYVTPRIGYGWRRRGAGSDRRRNRRVCALLRAHVDDPDPRVRVDCAFALGSLGDRTARPLLEALLDDDGRDGGFVVSEVARDALAALDGELPAWARD